MIDQQTGFKNLSVSDTEGSRFCRDAGYRFIVAPADNSFVMILNVRLYFYLTEI